jgi:hypothetical protein
MYLRVGSKGVTRRGLIALLLCGAAACGGRHAADDVRVALSVDPASPAAGADSAVRLTVRDRQSRPVQGARLSIEAHMSHPGMAPIVAVARETGEGIYIARIPFSMAGEWTLVASGVLADGSRLADHVERTTVITRP